MFFLTGVARFLFVPMAEAVMFAMIWSFILSRTLVPTMANYLLKPHVHHEGGQPPSRNPLVRFQRGFRGAVRAHSQHLSRFAVDGAVAAAGFVTGFLAFVAVSFLLVPFLGRNFFPSVDAGNILMHVRTQVGTRVEETANQLADVQKAIRKIIPPGEIDTLVDNIGMPISGINMTYNNTGVIGPQDGDIQIKLKEGHRPTAEYVQALREQLPRLFPGMNFSFLPADIVSQILNFGAPAPIDLQIRGANLEANFAYANKLLSRIRHIPGIADARIQQSPNNPTFNVDVDRTRAQYVGLTERDVTNSLVVNLAGSSQVAPTYLSQSGQWRVVFDRDADAAIPDRLAQRVAGAADHCHRQSRSRRSSAALRTSSARPPAPWCRSTTSSRWCRSTPPRRDAISARSRPTSGPSWPIPPRRCRRAHRSCCSARCRP